MVESTAGFRESVGDLLAFGGTDIWYTGGVGSSWLSWVEGSEIEALPRIELSPRPTDSAPSLFVFGVSRPLTSFAVIPGLRLPVKGLALGLSRDGLSRRGNGPVEWEEELVKVGV